MKTRFLVMAGLLAVGAAVNAQTLYSQSPIVGEEGGPFSEADGQQIADTMSPVASGQAGLATFWGSSFIAGDPFNVGDSFQFTLVTWDVDGSGNPNSILNQITGMATISSEAGVNGSGDMVYQYDMNLGGLGPNLTAGSSYMFSVWESDPNTPVNSWRWMNGSGPQDYTSFRSDANSGWSQDGGSRADLAFELKAVPEPATMLALGTGLAVILKRRKSK